MQAIRQNIQEVTQVERVTIPIHKGLVTKHTYSEGLDTERYEFEGGRYRVEQREVTVPRHVATLACHRLRQKGLDPVAAVSARDADQATSQVRAAMADLHCGTCPYKGMGELEAAEYDLRVADARLLTVRATAQTAEIEARLASLRQSANAQPTAAGELPVTPLQPALPPAPYPGGIA